MWNKIKSKIPFFGKGEPKKFGVLDTRFFSFITPMMIFIVIVVVAIVAANIETVLDFFATNEALNGLIIGLLHYGVFRIFKQNWDLRVTAKFLKSLDQAAEDYDEIPEEKIAEFKSKLLKQGRLVNIIQMQQCIEKMEDFGRIQFTDNDARFIKSKMGFRLNNERAGINFIAGLLVMLGLLGTFLGLLNTIDAIGNALGVMSDLKDASGMNKFIAALAAPLQGMGLAFSSSLFGLSGSLMIGFFTWLSGDSQNRFMEDVSRWIDNLIPRFDPKKIPSKQMQKAPSQDEMKVWLSGYVYLANKTNQKLGRLYDLLNVLAQTGIEANKGTKQMVSVSAETKEVIRQISEAFSRDIEGREEFFKGIGAYVGNMDGKLSQLVSSVDNARQGFAQQMEEALSNISQSIESFSDKMPDFAGDGERQSKAMEQLVQEIHMIKRAGDRFRSAQLRLSDELGVLATVLQDTTQDNARVHDIMDRVDGSLKEIVSLRKVLQAGVGKSSGFVKDGEFSQNKENLK